MNLQLPPWVLGLKRPFQIGFAAACTTALLSLFLPNYYKSEARVLPVEAKSMGGGLGNLAAAAAAFGVSVPGGDGSDANFVDILNSRTLREQLLQTTFIFHARAWRFGKSRERRETLQAFLAEKNGDRALKRLNEVVGVSRDLKSKVITVSAETTSPELSQQVAQRSLQLLEAFVQQKGRTRGGAKALFAEARLEEARKERAEAEDQFRAFLNGNRNYLSSPDPAVRLRGMRLESEYKLREQLVASLAMSREQALMEEKNDIPILNVLDPANVPLEKSKPARSVMVMLVCCLATAGSWAWLNRDWIRERLLDSSEGEAGAKKQGVNA